MREKTTDEKAKMPGSGSHQSGEGHQGDKILAGNNAQTFMFATGIECSYPTIDRGRTRRDQLRECRHYEFWRTDLELVKNLGIRFLRYGFPYHLVNFAPDKYDWSFSDQVIAEMKRLEIEPIIDLCHFGMPDWLGNSFQNPDFPVEFARYAKEFATRYPHVKLYTPVNEIFICAKFSALTGFWNEQLETDAAFVRAMCNLVKANLLATEEILKIQPASVFIQSESTERTHKVCACEHTLQQVDWENQIRFLSLDFLYSNAVRTDIFEWLMDNGMNREDYKYFMSNNLHERCVMGNDYYQTNERILEHDGSVIQMDEVFGWYLTTQEYYERYQKPVMHTETNLREGEQAAVDWLWKQWQQILHARERGMPVWGFTWYSLTDQIDWDIALREQKGTINPLGLYDLERKIRPVGAAYKTLIEEFQERTPLIQNAGFLQIA